MRSVLNRFLSGHALTALRNADPLWRAYCYAQELDCDAWEFAVEIDTLRAAGLENNDLRWLLHEGYVVSAVETAPARQGGRCFRALASLALPAGTCFVLTDTGAVRFADTFCGAGSGRSPAEDRDTAAAREGAPLPWWDADNRQLRFEGQLVKHFKVPAANQELILASFQEQGWPHHVDDPLPPLRELDSKRRLHDTIGRLNRNQKCRLVRFRGDGRGSGLYWEPAS